MVARTKHPTVAANLALIGGRGCGKSSVSKRIALTNRAFQLFSLDSMIQYEAGGQTIPEIVEARGWPEFRQLETEVLEKLIRVERGLVIDCGGGVVIDLDAAGEEIYSERKVAALRKTGLVIYLRRDVDYLASRIAGDRNRPDLSNTRSFHEIMARREPWYKEASHHVVDCDGLGKWDIAERILRLFYKDTGIELGDRPIRPRDV